MNRLIKSILYSIILVNTSISFSQKETNIWYFGHNAGLDFNNGDPIALTDGKLFTTEGCATISDKKGKLLFYTDGKIVYNKSHEIMKNGTGLNGDDSSTNSALIVPKPKSNRLYYIFTADFQGGVKGLQYSEVDMELDGGFGQVTKKNIKLHSPIAEKLTAIKGCNGDCIWLVTHKLNSSEFLSYKVTGQGVNESPIISDSGSISGNNTGAIGAIKISPNGKKLTVARHGQNVQLFDFDDEAGIVDNALTLLNDPVANSYYGIEFSPNSNVLYVGLQKKGVFQFNLRAGTNEGIINSKIEITQIPNDYKALQLAVNNKIYVADKGAKYLGAINNPNTIGLGCDYQYDSVYLKGRVTQSGLPPFIQSFFVIENIDFENICFGDSTKFSINNIVDSVVWDFGDSESGIDNKSTDLEPSHVFTNPGDYEVSITATFGNETVTESRTVTIFEKPSINSLVKLVQCDNDLDGFSHFNLNDVINKITSNSTNEKITFHATEVDAIIDNDPITDTNTYTNQIAGNDTVWARVENNNGCFRTSRVNLVVSTIEIPKYFTPNGDGINDFWQIKNSCNQLQINSRIYIYDRYGKLIKQLSSNSKGWDGTFNGKILPSDDYWFRALLDDGREFINHFTLKR